MIKQANEPGKVVSIIINRKADSIGYKQTTYADEYVYDEDLPEISLLSLKGVAQHETSFNDANCYPERIQTLSGQVKNNEYNSSGVLVSISAGGPNNRDHMLEEQEEQ